MVQLEFHEMIDFTGQSGIICVPPESTMYVVTFSGVTSGGIVTSGTRC